MTTKARAEVTLAVGQPEEVEGELAARVERGDRWVHLQGAASLSALLNAVGRAEAMGLQVALEGLPPNLPLDGLQQLGLHGARIVRLTIDDAPCLLEQEGQGRPRRVILTPVARLAEAVQVAVPLRADVEVEPGVPDASAQAALDLGLHAALEAGVEVRFDGLVLPPALPVAGPPLPVGPALLEALRTGLRPSCFGGGARLAAGAEPLLERWGGRSQVGLWMAAAGVPLQGEPTESLPCREGLGPGARVLVLLPFLGDRLRVASWPGLVEALRTEGVDAHLASAWHAPANPHGQVPGAGGSALAPSAAATTWAREGVATWARSLDLSTWDAVIAPGWSWGDLVLRHPSLGPSTRVIVADDHLSEGFDTWKKRWRPSGPPGPGVVWELDARVRVASAFPGFARLQVLAGLPLDRVRWRPYPLDRRVLPPPTGNGPIFAGGNHLRDHELLAEAVNQAGQGTPVLLVSHSRPRQAVPRLRCVPPLPLADFVSHIAASPFVVVAMEHQPDRAAGISVMALAHALGRPVVTTSTTAAFDHVRHDVDGLIVPANDAAALAHAIRRLDQDEALRARLGRGAARSGAAADVTAWARALVEGGGPTWPRSPGEVEGAAKEAEGG